MVVEAGHIVECGLGTNRQGFATVIASDGVGQHVVATSRKEIDTYETCEEVEVVGVTTQWLTHHLASLKKRLNEELGVPYEDGTVFRIIDEELKV
jgi:hypothetical protein